MKLNNLQLEKLSDILINLGIVFIATNVIPFFSNKSEIELGILMLSGMVSISFWFFAIYILKNT